MSSYHPRIFRKTGQEKNDTVQKEVKHNIIPEHTLYEEPLLVQKRSNRKYITVFGFSQGNLENVIKKIKEEVGVGNIEYGKNWINIMVDGEENASKLLRLNTCYVNGEIIGVFRESYGVIEDKDIFLKKRGLFGKIMVYLFGD